MPDRCEKCGKEKCTNFGIRKGDLSTEPCNGDGCEYCHGHPDKGENQDKPELKLMGYNCEVCKGRNFRETDGEVLHICEGFAERVYEPKPDCTSNQEIAEWEKEFDDRYSPLYFYRVGVSDGFQHNPNNKYADSPSTNAREVLLQKKAEEVANYQKAFIRNLLDQQRMEYEKLMAERVVIVLNQKNKERDELVNGLREAVRTAVCWMDEDALGLRDMTLAAFDTHLNNSNDKSE